MTIADDACTRQSASNARYITACLSNERSVVYRVYECVFKALLISVQ